MIEVNPAYSSFVGNMSYDYFDPISASLEICRRGINKYIKGNKQFGSVDSMDSEKVKSYLLSKNVQYGNLSEMTVPKLFKLFTGIKYRNVLVKENVVENYLNSVKSNVKCYNFI